jgi:hypothetical protein
MTTKAAFTATVLNARTVDFGLGGLRLSQMVQLDGMRNTTGALEVYKIHFDGCYNDGTVRADVHVQRSNGSFALLNANAHRSQISRVLRVAKDIGAEAAYLAANAAARAAA